MCIRDRYIYALWGEIRGMTEQVRYDFQKTMAELTVENFFRELTDWCHEKGALSRIQAHGTWGDILQAYGAADIPEGETFSAFDRYEVNTAVSYTHLDVYKRQDTDMYTPYRTVLWLRVSSTEKTG